MTEPVPTLSIFLVCYNAVRYLADCLNAVRERVTLPYEVILLDNGSTDHTSDVIRQCYPWVNLLRSEENVGFIRGNNIAAKHARGEYYLLLNSDTILLTDLVSAIKLLEGKNQIGVVGAKMYGEQNQVRPSAGRFPRALRLWRFGSLWVNPEEQADSNSRIFPVDWVEGSFLMTTAENWNAIGGLDESNFLYGDDIDFCRSTLERGLITVQCATTKYIHFGGFEPSRTGYLFAGYRHYHQKFSSRAERLLADVVLRVGLFGRVFVYGVRYLISREPSIGEKARSFAKLQRQWHQTASFAPRFE